MVTVGVANIVIFTLVRKLVFVVCLCRCVRVCDVCVWGGDSSLNSRLYKPAYMVKKLIKIFIQLYN